MSEKIRALLLSGGYGKRLRPITEKVPKCLIELMKTNARTLVN